MLLCRRRSHSAQIICLLIPCALFLYTSYRVVLHNETLVSGVKEAVRHNYQQTFKTTNNVVSEEDSQRQIMEQRKTLINNICERTGPISNKTMEVSGIKDNNLTFCVVQKAGCTIYIRLFKFLKGQNQQRGTPLSIGKYEVHYVKNGLYVQFTKNDEQFVKQSLRAMTVRDPYTRLWSAYIDKLLLPDFWHTKGKMIIKQTRKDASQKALQCGNDVTFPEFIKYVISNAHSMHYLGQDKHWLPASDICDPCVFKPDIINKQETFLKDLKYTLQNSNLTHMIPKLIAYNPTEYEINDEIDYNFKVLHRFEKCIEKLGLSKLIWKAFKLNGYIPTGEGFPTDINVDSLNAESLYEIVKTTRARHNMTKEDTHSARKMALTAAYSQISKEDMQSLKELYRNDFEMFGYKSEPDFLKQQAISSKIPVSQSYLKYHP